MEKVKQKRKQIDIDKIRSLIKEAGVTFYQIEKDLKISKAVVSRAIKENPDRPLPPRWELPILKYLRKKIQDKKELEEQTTEVLQELGFKAPEKESGLQENEKEIKHKWFQKLQN